MLSILINRVIRRAEARNARELTLLNYASINQAISPTREPYGVTQFFVMPWRMNLRWLPTPGGFMNNRASLSEQG